MTGAAPDGDLAVLAEVQGVLIEVLESRNAALEALVADLAERLAKVERAVSRNSGNSSMPPSADDLPGKTAPEPKPGRSGKKRQGKQPGAPGAHLAWSENPDKAEHLFPAGPRACGADLADAGDLGVAASHQVTDTSVVTATVTQYDRHAVACRCGRVHAAPRPAGAGEAGTVTYGLNLQAWAVFLLAVHHVPAERCEEVIAALTGTRPSDGWVHSMLARAAKAVRGVNMLIRALVITAAVLCADETPIRVGPGPKTRKKYLLVACTHLLTYYFLGGRSMKTFDAFVFPDLSGSVIVYDRYQNYDAIQGVMHQLCCAHILRDLQDAAQAHPDAIWPGQAAEALRALIHAASTARKEGLAAVPDAGIAEDLRLFRNAVRVGLSEVRPVPGPNAKQKPGRTLLECLHDREGDVLRFLSDLRVPPTSNQAERDLRPAKTQQKISGRLRSEAATRNRYAIRGYTDTARKHRADIITAIRDALAGNPWMPPIPDTAQWR
ncbi:MAG: IS66 family transposase [Trebonia sp.]